MQRSTAATSGPRDNAVPFTNLNFGWTCPADLREQVPVIGGEEMPFTYGELQAEMDLINRAYIEVMTTRDARAGTRISRTPARPAGCGGVLGGEPLYQRGLDAAATAVRAMGFRVGLHSGGAYPLRPPVYKPRSG